MRPLLLDLFCGAGGAGMGYHRAGFDVIGVDIKPQPRYPFKFVQGDAIDYALMMAELDHPFAAVHASPPCQRYSKLQKSWGHKRHPDLIGDTRVALELMEVPYVHTAPRGCAPGRKCCTILVTSTAGRDHGNHHPHYRSQAVRTGDPSPRHRHPQGH